MSSIHDHAHDRLQQQQQQKQQDEEQKMTTTTTTTITIGPIQQLHHDGSRSSTDNAVIIANNASKLAAAVKHTYSYKKRKYSVDNDQGRGLPLLSFPWKLHSLLEKNENEQRRQRQKHDDYNYDDDDDTHKHKRIFGWLPDGKRFAIHDQKRFVHEIMPSYFFFDGSSGSSGSYQSRIQSFQTFQRNLELWGFTTTSTTASISLDTNTIPTPMEGHEDYHGEDVVYSHPLFLKGCPAVCMNMKFGAPLSSASATSE